MKKLFNFRKLKYQYLLIMGSLIFVLVIGFGLSNYTSQKNNLLSHIEKEVSTLASLFSESALDPVFELNLLKLRLLTSDVLRQENIQYAYILNKEGKVIADGTEDNIHRDQKLKDKVDQALEKEILGAQKAQHGIYGPVTLHIARKITFGHGARHIGMVRIGYDLRPLYQMMAKLRQQYIGSACMLFLIGSVLAFWFSNMITRPLLLLEKGVQKISEGDFSQKVILDRKDELGRLALSFNKMAQDLKTITHQYQVATEKEKKRAHELQKAYQRLKQTQDQLVQAGKLTAIGQLSAGVAHELNQPLASIMLLCDIAKGALKKGKKDKDQKIKSTLERIDEDVDRARNIINHLRDFARHSEFKFQKTNLNKVIDGSLLMFGAQLKVHNINLKKDYDPNLPFIYGDKNQLEQIIVNFVSNAKYALDKKKGGDLIISTKVNNNGQVELRVSDTGIGMSKKIKDRVFDPFFTTKEVGTGTGLGLSIVYGIIEGHRGNINVKSKLNEGTSFIVTFPTYTEKMKFKKVG